MRWSLNELYSSFDSKEYKEDNEKIDVLIKDISKWADGNLESMENPVEKLEKYVQFSIDISNLFAKSYIICRS